MRDPNKDEFHKNEIDKIKNLSDQDRLLDELNVPKVDPNDTIEGLKTDN